MKTMLRLVSLMIPLAALFVLPACWVCSVNPLYQHGDKHLIYDPALEGTWRPESSDDCLLVITADPNFRSYMLQETEPPERKEGNCGDPEGKYDGALVQLGSTRFLDATPVGDATDRGFIASHSIFKVVAEGDSLSLVPLWDKWFCQPARESTRAIGECVKDSESDSDPDFLITAPTDVLQEFVQKHADDEQLFYAPDGRQWHRAGKPGALK